jgi:hypothetical protein
MATSSVADLRITGLANATQVLRALPAKLRQRALRNSLAAGARVVRNESRRRTPVLKRTTLAGASALKRGIRKVGTVQRAIAVRTSKANRRAGDVGVFVNVKPLKNGSARNPNDPYYWRWIDKGWNPARGGERTTRAARRRAQAAGRTASAKPGAFFMRAGAAKLPEALRVFETTLAPQVQRFQTGGGR